MAKCKQVPLTLVLLLAATSGITWSEARRRGDIRFEPERRWVKKRDT